MIEKRPGHGNGRGANGSRVRPLTESVLRMIWEERRISRSDIARCADLSRSTVSDIVGNLLPTGLVSESGRAPSRGGRRPIVLEFCDDAYGILGVEVGAAHVAVALTDLRGRVLVWDARPHDVREDPVGTRALVTELCDMSLAHWGRGTDALVGIGVAMPAPIHPEDEECVSKRVLPEWNGRHGFEELGIRYGVPVMVDNDANLGALAERWWGHAQGVDDFAYIKVATGVGSGHMVHGRVYRGASGVAGEIGHVAIDPAGDECVCGLRGCLVTFVGRQAMLQRAAHLISQGAETSLELGTLTMGALEDAALSGDSLALTVVQEVAGHLAVALAGLLNIMNPSMVVIGGDLARLGDVLLDPLREKIRCRTLVSSFDAARVRTSDLGPRSVAVGAATSILEAALGDARLFPIAAFRKEAP